MRKPRHQPTASRNNNPFHRDRKGERGASILAATAIVLLLLVAIGIVIASSSLFEGYLSEVQRQSQDAYLGAETGVKDAMIKIARNKNFSSSGYFIPSDPSNCTLNGDSVCTRVIVEKDTASVCSQAIGAGQDCIIATGTLNTVSRTLEIILNVNAVNGKITQVSWEEI